MKALGTALLFLGSFFACRQRICAERKKTALIFALAQALAFMAEEIRWRLISLPRLLGLCRKRCRKETAAFFADVEKDLERGLEFADAWKMAAERLEVTKGTKECLQEVCAVLESDGETVARSFETAARRVGDEARQRKEAQSEKEKLWAALYFSAAGLLWIAIV